MECAQGHDVNKNIIKKTWNMYSYYYRMSAILILSNTCNLLRYTGTLWYKFTQHQLPQAVVAVLVPMSCHHICKNRQPICWLDVSWKCLFVSWNITQYESTRLLGGQKVKWAVFHQSSQWFLYQRSHRNKRMEGRCSMHISPAQMWSVLSAVMWKERGDWCIFPQGRTWKVLSVVMRQERGDYCIFLQLEYERLWLQLGGKGVTWWLVHIFPARIWKVASLVMMKGRDDECIFPHIEYRNIHQLGFRIRIGKCSLTYC